MIQFNTNLSLFSLIYSILFVILGGETITITGSGLGGSATSADAVKINGAAATITSYSDTTIVVVLPPNPPGVYSVEVTVGTNGFADAGSVLI